MPDTAEVALGEDFAQRVAWAIDGAISHATTERARRSSEEARVVLEAGNQLRDTFLASLSHELRTPMAALLLWVDILRTAKEGPMRLRALNAIHVSAMAQSKLIEDLLDISRCLSGKLLMENRVVSVGTLIESALEAALPSARAKGVRLDPEYHAALGCVLGDSARLCQVLGNLLSNAIKFTDRGGLIAVRAVRVGTRVEISVIDTGCGISPDFLPQVFLPFRQAASGLPQNSGRARPGAGDRPSAGGDARRNGARREHGARPGLDVRHHVAAGRRPPGCRDDPRRQRAPPVASSCGRATHARCAGYGS